MKDWFAATITIVALFAPAAESRAQSEQPQERRDLAQWSGDFWQRLLAMPITPPHRDGRPVRVKIQESGANIEADVFVVSQTCVDRATDTFLNSHFRDHKVPLLASRFGTRYHTDKSGFVRVDLPRDGILLAIAGNHIGRRKPQKGTTFVGVREHAVVRAEVIDKDGRPATNVPVSIAQVHIQFPLVGACSDAQGRVALRIPKALLNRQVSIEAQIAGQQRGAQIVPKSYFDKAAALLQVQLPATGEVRAIIVDDLGVLPKRASQATLMWFVDGRPGTNFGLAPSRWQDGTAVFAHVALGLPIEATMRGGSRLPFKADGESSTKPGTTTELSVRVPAKQLALRGRLLAEANGTVQPGTYLVRICEPSRVQHDFCSVAADGRFLLAVDSSQFNHTPVHFEFFAGQPQKNKPNLVAITNLNGDRRGLVAVGDLQLQRERMLVGGRIMLDDKPVAARIEAPLACAPGGPFGHRTMSGKDGKFVLFEAAPPQGVLELTISHGWPPKNHRVTATIGKADLLFQLEASRTLSFTVAKPQFLPLLRYKAVSKADPRRVTTGTATRNGFQFQNLPAGRHDITVHLGRYELARFDAVDTDRGNADPRFQNITWQHAFKSSELCITDDAGKPLGAHCYVATGSRKNSLWRLSDKDGRVTLPYAANDKIFVRHGGSRSAIVTPSDNLQTIRLRPRATLQLQLPEGLTLPGRVELHFSSELQQFGLKDHVHTWRSGQPNSVRPEADKQTVLRVIAHHVNGKSAVLHEQSIELPHASDPIKVVIGIDEDDAAFAADLAAQRKRGDR